jgi:hypothetical protein
MEFIIYLNDSGSDKRHLLDTCWSYGPYIGNMDVVIGTIAVNKLKNFVFIGRVEKTLTVISDTPFRDVIQIEVQRVVS